MGIELMSFKNAMRFRAKTKSKMRMESAFKRRLKHDENGIRFQAEAKVQWEWNQASNQVLRETSDIYKRSEQREQEFRYILEPVNHCI
jgi:hypothetical protein